MLASWTARLAATSLPLAAVALAERALRPSVRDWRERWLVAATAAAAWLALSSELLGLLGRIDRPSVIAGWIVAAAIAALAARRAPAQPASAPAARSTREIALAVSGVAILALLLAVAVLSTPNSVDAMGYHLPRVARWIAHQSLAPFRTADIRQIELAPFGELALLHSLLLWTSDRFAQSVQWLATVGTLLAIGATAARLGASRSGQLVAALGYLSIPIATLHATSTENDAVLVAWIALLALAVLATGQERRAGSATARLWPWVAGVAAGLAIYTKGTAFFFAAPLLAWMGIEALLGAPRAGAASERPERRIACLLATATALVLPVLLLNGLFWLRNVHLFGSPLSSLPVLRHATAHNPTAALSTAVRSIALHANVVGVDAAGRATVERAVRRLHAAAGADPDDPRTTRFGRRRFEIPGAPLHEYTAGAGWHVGLAAFLATAYGAAALVRRARRRQPRSTAPPRPRGTGRLVLATGTGLVLMSALLPWQPWIARLQLPAFALGAAVAGVLADRLLPRRGLVGFGLLLALGTLPATVRNHSRPLLGSNSILHTDPTTQLFAGRPELRRPMTDFVARLERSACRQVAQVATPYHEYEYPLWRLLNGPARSPRRFRLEDVQVTNYTRDLPYLDRTAFEPCAVVLFAGRRFQVLTAPWLPAKP